MANIATSAAVAIGVPAALKGLQTFNQTSNGPLANSLVKPTEAAFGSALGSIGGKLTSTGNSLMPTTTKAPTVGTPLKATNPMTGEALNVSTI